MSWAREEFKDLELGDARRTQRVIKLVDDLSAQPTGSIPLACGGWPETKAAYRLLDNPAVEWREILEVHTTRTVERMAGQPVVLCMQDTTQADFTSQPGIAGLGRLSHETQHGLYVHPTLALGVLDAWMWARRPKDPPDVKESTRWVEGDEIVADLAETLPDTRLGYVADREGDLRALIDAAARRGASADGLIRSKHNRKTTTGEKRWARLAQSEALGEVEFALPARQVRQTLTHGGDAAGASRPTRRDHDRDPGSRGTPAGRREGDRVAAVDPPDRRDPGAGGRTRGRVDGYRRRLVRLIAGFGGFLGRKHDGHPDPKAIWEGMQKVRAFAITLEASRAAYTSSG